MPDDVENISPGITSRAESESFNVGYEEHRGRAVSSCAGKRKKHQFTTLGHDERCVVDMTEMYCTVRLLVLLSRNIDAQYEGFRLVEQQT